MKTFTRNGEDTHTLEGSENCVKRVLMKMFLGINMTRRHGDAFTEMVETHGLEKIVKLCQLKQLLTFKMTCP